MNTEPLPYYRVLLKRELADRIARNSRYSLRAFAAALGIQSSALSQILSGKRFLTEKLAKRFFAVLSLSLEEQHRFLYSIAEAKKDLGIGRMSPRLKSMLKKKPLDARTDLTPEIFQVIADWYHGAILEMTHLDAFRPDPKWIAQQLGISSTEAKLAIDRLMELELLESIDGKTRKTEAWLDSVDKTITSGAHKRFVRQIHEKSLVSLENDPIEIRNHSAIAFPIDSDRIAYAKFRIQKFMWELVQELSAGKKDSVYELNINLFPVQIRRSIKKGVKK